MRIYSLLFLILICSCSKEKEQMILPDFTKADKVTLTYKTDFDSAGKIILKNIDITDPEEISKLRATITTIPFDYQYCLSTGTMAFYKDSSVIIEVVFNTTKDFRHIAFNYNNKLIAIALTEKDAAMLDSYKDQISAR